VSALASAGSSTAIAGANDPLFVNATSDDGYRATMALTFSQRQLERKHPITILLSDRGVLIASKANAKKFKDQQALLVALMNAGASVIVCPMCMKHFGVNEADILPGIKVGTPDGIDAALFQDNVKTLSW
jgi:sulfur relay (sulfurtransferase) complex TusBCD TusD component (DsrE family)